MTETSPATFHRQLVDKLKDLLRAGLFPPGTKFYTEREVAEKFQTSRPTANKAISSLVAEGRLEVRRGAGTFVREAPLEYELERLVSFSDKARSVGKVPGTHLLTFQTIAANRSPQVVQQCLNTTAEDQLIYMERIRLADNRPVIYECRYVLQAPVAKMTRLDAQESLFHCWTHKCGLVISGTDEVIQAIAADRLQADRLGIKEGTPCFMVTSTGYVNGDNPTWYEETIYRGDIYEFKNRVRGILNTQAALGQIK